jgi:hypothetical protein
VLIATAAGASRALAAASRCEPTPVVLARADAAEWEASPGRSHRSAGRHSMTTRTIAIAAFVIAVIVLILILM